MTIEYTYDPAKQIVSTKFIGVVKFDDVVQYLDDLVSDSALNKPFVEVVDLSKTVNFDFGYKKSRKMIDKYVHLASFDNYKGTVFVADRDFTRGMSNMFKMVGEVKSINVQIVGGLEEAYDAVNGRLP